MAIENTLDDELTYDELVTTPGQVPPPPPSLTDGEREFFRGIAGEAARYLAAGNRVTLLRREGDDHKHPLMPGFLDPKVNVWGLDELRGQLEWAVGQGLQITGLGIIQGELSGHRYTLDFDRGDLYDGVRAKVLDDTGFDVDSLPRVRSGRTSSEGYHVVFRTTASIPKQKLFMVAAGVGSDGRQTYKVAVELIGTGGQCVAPPSIHKSGKRYVAERGDVHNPPVIPWETAEAILASIRSLDQRKEREPRQRPQDIRQHVTTSYPTGQTGKDVIAAYNARHTIHDVLDRFGYVSTGDDTYKHPNKGETEHSVTVSDNLATFWSPNDPMAAHGHPNKSGGVWGDAFDVYCGLVHGGDRVKAIREASQEFGMGRPAAHAMSAELWPSTAETILGITDKPFDWGKSAPPEESYFPKRRLKFRSSRPSAQPRVAEPPTIIEGLLRQGEIANVISSPKMRKSWAMGDLAFSAANGTKWLGRFQCRPTKVLVIDNELREWQLQQRYETLREARGLAADSPDFTYVSLRDDGAVNINELCEMLDGVEGFGLIILDALYRFFPEKFDENSNADWTRLYNTLDRITRRTGSAIVCVHHASKGNQAGKATTDAGSGAGSQSRAADAHIVLRAVTDPNTPEDAPSRASLTAVVRGFVPVDPVPLVWDFPFWRMPIDASQTDMFPKAKKTPRGIATDSYSREYGRHDWESRATIEARAKEDGHTVRDARDLFTGALAEGLILVREQKDGRSVTKTYKISDGAGEMKFAA